MNQPQEQVARDRMAVHTSAHDVTRTPAWQAARTLRILATAGDVHAARKHVAVVADDPAVDAQDVLKHLVEQIALPLPPAA